METPLIPIGRYKNKEVFYGLDSALNKHLAMVGKTGAGKSVQMQKMQIELAKQGKTVLVFDHHSVADGNQIFPTCKKEFELLLHEVDVYKKGISCQLFSSVVFSDGDEEDSVDTVGAILEVLSRTMRLGSKQKGTLRRALAYVYETEGYEAEGFTAVDNALEKNGTAVAETVREKLYPLTAHNVFRSGKLFIEPGRVNVVRLSKFDLETQAIIAEVLLAYLWRLAMTFRFRDQELFIFIDEFQFLPSGKNCALEKVLSEGRKFGVNLVLATQQMALQSSSVVQQKLMQCGMILFFRPNTAQVVATAKMIDPAAAEKWMLVLRTLGKGEFVAMGALIVNARLYEKPLRISAFEDAGEDKSVEESKRGRGTVRM